MHDRASGTHCRETAHAGTATRQRRPAAQLRPGKRHIPLRPRQEGRGDARPRRRKSRTHRLEWRHVRARPQSFLLRSAAVRGCRQRTGVDRPSWKSVLLDGRRNKPLASDCTGPERRSARKPAPESQTAPFGTVSQQHGQPRFRTGTTGAAVTPLRAGQETRISRRADSPNVCSVGRACEHGYRAWRHGAVSCPCASTRAPAAGAIRGGYVLADHGTCSSTDCRTRRAAYCSPTRAADCAAQHCTVLAPSIASGSRTDRAANGTAENGRVLPPATAPPPRRQLPQTTAKRGAEITAVAAVLSTHHTKNSRRPAHTLLRIIESTRSMQAARGPAEFKLLQDAQSWRRQAATGSRQAHVPYAFFEAAAIRTSNEPWRPLLSLYKAQAFTGRSRRRPDIPSTHRQPRSAPG